MACLTTKIWLFVFLCFITLKEGHGGKEKPGEQNSSLENKTSATCMMNTSIVKDIPERGYENDLGVSLDCNLGISLEDELGVSFNMNSSKDEEMNTFSEFSTGITSPFQMTSTPIKERLVHRSDFQDNHHFAIDSSPCQPNSYALSDVEMSIISNTNQSDLEISGYTTFSDVIMLSSESSVCSDVSLSNVDTDVFHHVHAITKRRHVPNISPARHSALKKKIKTYSIDRCLRSKCCKHQCLQKFGINDVRGLRTKYWSKKPSERHQWILDKFMEQGELRAHLLFRTDKGIPVCKNAFLVVYGINKNVYYIVRKKFLQGAVTATGNRLRQRTEKYIVALNWLEDYASYHGDRRPDCPTVYLPYRTKKNVIYQQYKTENDVHVKVSTFYRIWESSFQNLKIKQINSFSKCTKCASIERQLERNVNPSKRERLLKLRQEHNQRQMSERKYYYNKRSLAKATPSKYLSLIIDGMDQAKTNLPHFVGRMAKSVNPTDQLSTHVTGILAHGQNLFYTFLDWNQYPHDSNMTINLLLMILYKISISMGGRLPPVLYLQADNCWRENKNKYVLAFCETLVHLKIFNEVHLSFLYVGHTHEDVDAAFSKISDKLRRNDAETLPELCNLLPNVEEITWMYDIKEWISHDINDVRKHTKPLHYKFCRDVNNGHVKFSYRENQEKPWKILNTGILSSDEKGKVKLPKSIPKLLNPSFEKVKIENLQARLPFWQCLFSNQIEHPQLNWWKNFILTLQKLRDNTEFRKQQIMSKAFWILPRLPRQPSQQQSGTDDSEPPECIQRMLAAETQDHDIQVIPITSGSKRVLSRQAAPITAKRARGGRSSKSAKRTSRGKSNGTSRTKERRTIFHTYLSICIDY